MVSASIVMQRRKRPRRKKELRVANIFPVPILPHREIEVYLFTAGNHSRVRTRTAGNGLQRRQCLTQCLPTEFLFTRDRAITSATPKNGTQRSRFTGRVHLGSGSDSIIPYAISTRADGEDRPAHC